jgi:selenide, water dikinase
VTGATDVTGFGLAGHADALARESRLTLEIDAAALPILPGALPLAGRFQAGGLGGNRREFEPRVEYRGDPGDAVRALLYDPQTSGGLLLLVPEAECEALLAGLDGARAIGRALAPGAKPLIVRA